MMKRPSSTLSNPIAIPQPRPVASIQDNTSDYGSIDSAEASILSTLSPEPESRFEFQSQSQARSYAAQSRSQPASQLVLEESDDAAARASDIESDYGDLDEVSALDCLSQAESQPLNPRTLVLEPLADPIFELHAGRSRQDAGAGDGARSASLRLPVTGFERDIESSLYSVDEHGNKIGRSGIGDGSERMARAKREAAVEVEYDFRNRIQFSREFCPLPSHG